MTLIKVYNANMELPVTARRNGSSAEMQNNNFDQINNINMMLLVARLIDYFLLQVQVVPIYNNGDPKRPKGVSNALREYALAHNQLPPSLWLRAC